MIESHSAHVTLETPPGLDGVVVCRLAGEIDIDCRPEVRAVFSRALDRATRGVLVDCGRLSFCDSTLLNALINLRNRAGARPMPVFLVAPSRQLRQLLDLTGTTHLLPAHPTLARALAACPPPQP
ncbi:STAS domain-containing protein [Streptomyces sp. NPDC089919]|uniref:STAS domain-containing protein n=1 Tax=Streptomyces sp. NPDC089919 TaxID=3155188 RepID=UPI0034129A87